VTDQELATVLHIIHDRAFLLKFVRNREFFERLRLSQKEPRSLTKREAAQL
jgi:hypothetical protein